MTNDERQPNPPTDLTPLPQPTEAEHQHPSIATKIAAVGGGVAGAAIGHSLIGGKLGTAIGLVAGAIAGGVSGDKIAEFAEPTIGAQLGGAPGDLPAHYSWAELQALSKPQA